MGKGGFQFSGQRATTVWKTPETPEFPRIGIICIYVDMYAGDEGVGNRLQLLSDVSNFKLLLSSRSLLTVFVVNL